MRLSDMEKQAENMDVTPWRIMKWVFVLMFGVSVLGVAGSYLGLFGRVVTLPADLAKRTIDPDNVIANYEWFKRQYQDVRAMDVRLTAAAGAQSTFEQAAGERAKWTFEDKQEWNRLNTILLGLKGQRASMVAEYNARTQMMNRDLFRTSDLPATLE